MEASVANKLIFRCYCKLWTSNSDVVLGADLATNSVFTCAFFCKLWKCFTMRVGSKLKNYKIIIEIYTRNKFLQGDFNETLSEHKLNISLKNNDPIVSIAPCVSKCSPCL